MVYHNKQQNQGKQQGVNEESDPAGVVICPEGRFLIFEVTFDAQVVDLVTQATCVHFIATVDVLEAEAQVAHLAGPAPPVDTESQLGDVPPVKK